MQLRRTREFDQEREKYAFAGSCETCAHFDRKTERCRHEYPTEPHRERTYRSNGGQKPPAPPGEAGRGPTPHWRPEDDVLVFCKEFELE